MKVGFYHVSKELCQNEVIFGYKSPMRADDTNKKLGDLYQECIKLDIELNCITSEEMVDDLDAILVGDLDLKKDSLSKKIMNSTAKKILLLEECDVIRPDLWQETLWKLFDAIITWDDELAAGDKFVHSNFIDVRTFLGGNTFANRKHACLIAANKSVLHDDELYSKRLEVIEWFELNDPKNFELFGTGWDQKTFPLHSSLLSKLNGRRGAAIRKFLAPERPAWRGQVHKKINVLRDYRFCFAFENACNRPGYILEKIFDPMYAGCVPIYWGAKNIDQYLPEGTFIDFRNFDSIADCNSFLKDISEDEYEIFVENIKSFFNSASDGFFSSKNFVGSVIKTLNNVTVSTGVNKIKLHSA